MVNNYIIYMTIQAQTLQTHPPSRVILSNWCGLQVCAFLLGLGQMLKSQPGHHLQSPCATLGPFDLSRTISRCHIWNTSTCPRRNLIRSKSLMTFVQSSIRRKSSKKTLARSKMPWWLSAWDVPSSLFLLSPPIDLWETVRPETRVVRLREGVALPSWLWEPEWKVPLATPPDLLWVESEPSGRRPAVELGFHVVPAQR
jgi:hypothetical protein